MGPSQTLKKLLNPVKILVKDSSQYTRAALGSVNMSLAAVIKKQEVHDHLVPLFLQVRYNYNVIMSCLICLCHMSDIIMSYVMCHMLWYVVIIHDHVLTWYHTMHLFHMIFSASQRYSSRSSAQHHFQTRACE